MICFGLLGTGTAATTHARELGAIRGATLTAVTGRRPDRVAAFVAAHAAVHPELRACATLQDMLADPALDAVVITTPNAEHLEPALAVARAGKHVILEKPIEITRARSEAIVAACRENGVRLHLVYQRRHSASTLRARDDIAAGRFGEIILVNIVDNQFRAPEYYAKGGWRGRWQSEGGGCVTTQSTHMIDLVQVLLGPIKAVTALCRTRLHTIETEDTAAALLEFENGVIGTFTSSTAAYPGQRHLMTISGTRGSMIFNAEHDEIVLRQFAGNPAETGAEIPDSFSFRDPSVPADYPTYAHRRLLQAIVDDLSGGDSVMQADPLAAIRAIEALYSSAAKGGMRVAVA